MNVFINFNKKKCSKLWNFVKSQSLFDGIFQIDAHFEMFEKKEFSRNGYRFATICTLPEDIFDLAATRVLLSVVRDFRVTFRRGKSSSSSSSFA